MLGERWRKAKGIERLEVKVLPGPVDGFRADKLPPYGGAERKRWLENIVFPMPLLLPSCGATAELVERDYRAPGPTFGRGRYTVGPSTWRQAFEDGDYPFVCPADLIARKREDVGDNCVTITLRNTGWWVERSSDLTQWLVVANDLERAGYRVVFVPDGTRADDPVDVFETDPQAAREVIARAALYSAAVLNIGVSNGPLWLCWFMGLPTLICKLINENEPSAGVNNFRRMGLAPGMQPRHARPGQRLLWASDRAEILLANTWELLDVVSTDPRATARGA